MKIEQLSDFHVTPPKDPRCADNDLRAHTPTLSPSYVNMYEVALHHFKKIYHNIT